MPVGQPAHEVAVADVALDERDQPARRVPSRGSRGGRGRGCRARRSRRRPRRRAGRRSCEPMIPAPPVIEDALLRRACSCRHRLAGAASASRRVRRRSRGSVDAASSALQDAQPGARRRSRGVRALRIAATNSAITPPSASASAQRRGDHVADPVGDLAAVAQLAVGPRSAEVDAAVVDGDPLGRVEVVPHERPAANRR